MRYWDGVSWTSRLQPAPSVLPAPPVAAASDGKVRWLISAAVAFVVLAAVGTGLGAVRVWNVLAKNVTLPGAGPQPVVTPAQAREVVTALWPLREQARATGDLAALAQVDTAAALEGDRLWVGCRCHRPGARPLKELQVHVPRQASYPAQFLAQVVTTDGPQITWGEIMIFTRVSARDSWQVALATGGGVDAGSRLPMLPLAEDLQGFAVRPDSGLHPRAVSMAGRLTGFWTKAKINGVIPDPAEFGLMPGTWTTKRAGAIAAHPQDSVNENHLRGHFTYLADPNAPLFEYLVKGSDLACTVVREEVVWTPPAGLFAIQDAQQRNWGGSLAPGRYRTITQHRQWQTCFLFPAKGGGAAFVIGGNGHSESMAIGSR